MFQRGYGGLRWSENHQKHAQSTYLDEYLWFKKNLAKKFRLAAKIGEFPHRFFFIAKLETLQWKSA